MASEHAYDIILFGIQALELYLAHTNFRAISGTKTLDMFTITKNVRKWF